VCKNPVAIIFLVVCPLLVAQQAQPAPETPAAPMQATPAITEQPRVFITDSESWESFGSAGGGHGIFGSQSRGGARPQTAEIIKTFGQRCPQVIVNNKQEIADYIVVLDHEGGKGVLQHRNKVAVFDHASGDIVISESTLSLGGSVEEACKGIVQHWAAHGAEILAAKEKSAAVTPASAITTTVPVPIPAPPPAQASVAIDSTPPGADIEIDSAFVGNTPSTVTVPSGSHQIVVKKKGFTDWAKTLNVTGGTVHLSAELEQEPPKQ
jgi:hypothetical protein